MSEVAVEVDGGHEVVAAITAESARSLGLAAGRKVVVVIKSTEVMLAVERRLRACRRGGDTLARSLSARSA